jgi:hypothetical protein
MYSDHRESEVHGMENMKDNSLERLRTDESVHSVSDESIRSETEARNNWTMVLRLWYRTLLLSFHNHLL